MKKLIYPVLGLAIAFSVQSCDNWKAKYLNEKSLVDQPGMVFLNGAIEGGMTEIAASKLAVANSTNPDVVNFAKMMITDHTKADSTLLAIEDDQRRPIVAAVISPTARRRTGSTDQAAVPPVFDVRRR